MTEEAAASPPPPQGSGARLAGRLRDLINVVRTFATRAAHLFASGAESPLADFRVALGHIRPAWVAWISGGLILFAYLSTGVYTVAPGEAAVVRRFSSVIEPRVGPGLHYRLPWPVDRVDIVNMNLVRREQVGALESEADHPHPEPPSKLQALSGDTNVVDVEAIVQYQVRDPVDYLFSVEYASYRLVRDVLRAAATNLVTRLPVDSLLTIGLQALQKALREETQKRLDRYRSGVVVVGIDLQKAFPPSDVADAFTAVNTAREQKARAINEARGYANSVIPEARGEAQRLLSAGQAYRSEVLANATGSASAFESVLTEYRKNSAAYGADVTRYRMYLETIDVIMPRVQLFALGNSNDESVNLRLFGDWVGGPDAADDRSR